MCDLRANHNCPSNDREGPHEYDTIKMASGRFAYSCLLNIAASAPYLVSQDIAYPFRRDYQCQIS